MKSTSKLIIFIFTFLALAATVYAQSPREQLQQMVEQLQKAPNDNALRERVIKLGAELNPAPAVSDEAIRYEGRAQFAFTNAKSADDYLAAAKEYEKAVAAAPWVQNYYSDLCKIYEKAGKFDDAKRNCGFYLIGLSDPAEMTDVKRRIAGLDFGIEKAASANAEAERAAQTARANAKADETLIVPGERIGRIRIGMNESQVVAALGSPTEREVLEYNGEVQMTWEAENYDINLSLTGNDGVVSRVVTSRRLYATAEGLSVGSSLSDVTAVMGNPGRRWESELNRGAKVCYSQGIVFSFADGGGAVGASVFTQRSKVRAIVVVNPTGALRFCN